MTTSTDITPATKIALLKHLAAGKGLDVVATIVHLSRDQVLDVASHHGYPDREKLTWAVDVLEKRADAATAVPDRTPEPRVTTYQAPVPRPAPPASSRPELVDVVITELHPDPNNPRDDVGDVTELAKSMKSAGLLQPVIARRDTTTGRLIVVAGHRRLAAAQDLGWTRVPTVVRRDMAPDKVLAAMLIENGQRADLDPIEEARALGRLRDDHQLTSHRELANLIGRTQVHVSGRLALLALTPEEQEQIRAGQLNLTDGIRRGRIASGRVREPGTTGRPHLGADNDLATRVRARCRRLKHKAGGRNSVGGVGCGECWESVIRADEREHLHTESNRLGRCVLCDVDKTPSQEAS